MSKAKKGIRGPVITPLASIKPYERNAKRHTNATLDALKASIQQFGYSIPPLIDEDGVLLAGHGRVEAAKRAGLTEVPVLIVEGWSEIEKREYRILDNRTAELSAWNDAQLKSALHALEDMEFSFAGIGFKPLAESKRGELIPDKDALPPAVAKEGDIYRLGRHRLVCGDSTNAAVVAAVLDGRQPRLMVTDPPYGVNYDDSWRAESGRSNVVRGKLSNDDRSDWRLAFEHFTGPTAYTWFSAVHTVDAAQSLEVLGFKIEANIAWVKNRMAIGMGWMHWKHEGCLYAERKAPNKLKSVWHGKDESTVMVTTKAQAYGAHPTIKPSECMAIPIRNSSSKGDVVYEPFAGSGTTIVAAEAGGRVCCAVEIDPYFVDLAVERWEAGGGEKAVKL